MYGWSYGGFMTLYSLLNAPGRFEPASPERPLPVGATTTPSTPSATWGCRRKTRTVTRASSAVTYADKLQSKLLMVHNIEDDNVLFQNTMQMAAAFEKAGKLFDMVVYPQKSHGVGGELQRQLLEKTTDFFEKNLKAADERR